MKRFFYGWIILPAAILGTLASIPGQTVGVSVFTDFLLAVHSISRSGISLAYLIGTISSAFLLSFAGRVYDRLGARRMGVPVVLFLALTLMFLSFSDHIASKAARVTALPETVVSFIVLAFGFFLVRFFGQGNLTMLSRNMTMKWFDRRRGLANAFLGISVSLGFSAAPGLIDRVITSAGWRETWRMMALGLAFFAVFVFFIFRDDPRDMGQKADGGVGGTKRKAHPFVARLKPVKSLPDRDFTLQEARRRPEFWLVALTIALSALLITAATFHVVSIFGQAGISRSRAVALFFPASLVAVASQFIGSTLSDYVGERLFALIQLVGCLLLAAVVVVSSPLLMQILFIFGVGLSQGMMGITSAIIWPRLFGLSHLGAISGFAMALSVAGSAIGPFTFSLSLDLFDSYGGAGISFIVLAFALMLFAFFVKPHEPEEADG
jgi:sugar phosphate permease